MADIDSETMEEGSYSQQTNPLYNDLVLETLFKYFSVADLKNVRGVCRLYNEIARPFLQDNSIVKLDENVHLQGIALDKFLEDFAGITPDQVFFRNYKLSLWNMDPNIPRVMEFWATFGNSIRSLEMSWGRFVGIEIVKNIMFNWTPNMRRICIRDCSFYASIPRDDNRPTGPFFHVIEQAAEADYNVRVNQNVNSLEFYGGEPHTHPPLKWEEIFIAYPNLKQLLTYNLTPIENLVILEAIKELRKKDPHAIDLEKLNVFNGDYAASEIPAHVLNCLLDLKLPLTQLDIDIGAHCNEPLIAKLLDQHSKRVKKLTIYRGPLGSPMCNFPFEIVFPKLSRLEMTETVADNFNFIQYTPSLTSLSICEPPDVEPPFLPTDMIFKTDYDFPLKTLPLHLRTLRIDYDCSYGDVRKLVHWFPKIKNVKMYLCNESLRTVCGEWNLETLEVLGDRVNDEGITGMKLKRENGQEIVIRNPLCIHNLKDLRTFIMKNYGMSTALSDLSVHHGFLRMKSLSYLELCSRNISEAGWKALYDMSCLTTLIPSDGRWHSNVEAFRKGVRENCDI